MYLDAKSSLVYVRHPRGVCWAPLDLILGAHCEELGVGILALKHEYSESLALISTLVLRGSMHAPLCLLALGGSCRQEALGFPSRSCVWIIDLCPCICFVEDGEGFVALLFVLVVEGLAQW